MHRALAVLALAVSFLIAGCSGLVGERGSGDLVSEAREVAPFTGIDVSRAIEVEVTMSAGAEPAVEVIYDDNLIDDRVVRCDARTGGHQRRFVDRLE